MIRLVQHIMPMVDECKHTESSGCKCKPTIETLANGDILIIHNSYDGREALERQLDKNKDNDIK
jgi:hypothetical protein